MALCVLFVASFLYPCLAVVLVDAVPTLLNTPITIEPWTLFPETVGGAAQKFVLSLAGAEPNSLVFLLRNDDLCTNPPPLARTDRRTLVEYGVQMVEGSDQYDFSFETASLLIAGTYRVCFHAQVADSDDNTLINDYAQFTELADSVSVSQIPSPSTAVSCGSQFTGDGTTHTVCRGMPAVVSARTTDNYDAASVTLTLFQPSDAVHSLNGLNAFLMYPHYFGKKDFFTCANPPPSNLNLTTTAVPITHPQIGSPATLVVDVTHLQHFPGASTYQLCYQDSASGLANKPYILLPPTIYRVDIAGDIDALGSTVTCDENITVGYLTRCRVHAVDHNGLPAGLADDLCRLSEVCAINKLMTSVSKRSEVEYYRPGVFVFSYIATELSDAERDGAYYVRVRVQLKDDENKIGGKVHLIRALPASAVPKAGTSSCSYNKEANDITCTVQQHDRYGNVVSTCSGWKCTS